MTLFWSQNGPCTRLLWGFGRAKTLKTGSKHAANICLGIPSGVGIGHSRTDTFLTPFWPYLGPKIAHFEGLGTLLKGPNGSKQHLDCRTTLPLSQALLPFMADVTQPLVQVLNLYPAVTDLQKWGDC